MPWGSSLRHKPANALRVSRRVLCDMLGAEMQNGELPNDEALVGQMVRRICYQNVREYFDLSA
jgi:glucuronate isomerase